MRMSDWSSDVCSSDLLPYECTAGAEARGIEPDVVLQPGPAMSAELEAPAVDLELVPSEAGGPPGDRKSVVEGKSVSVRVDIGGRWIIKKKNNYNKTSLADNINRNQASE